MELEGETLINVQKYDLDQVGEKMNRENQSKVYFSAQESQGVRDREVGGVQEGEGNERQRGDQKLRR